MESRMAGKSLYAFFTFFFLYNVQAQPRYNCKANHSMDPCQTYVVYRATGPDFLDLASIADLFGVRALVIAEANSISSPSSRLRPHQPIFVPIQCSCHSVNSSFAISYAAINYTLRENDTLFSVYSQPFQNLVTFGSVRLVNPEANPMSLYIGAEAVFPIFCKCPNSEQVHNRVEYMITYVFQPDDTLSSIASSFGSSEKFILETNGDNITPLDVVIIPIPRLPDFAVKRGAVLGLEIALGICGAMLVLVSGLWCYREYQFKKMGRINGDEKQQKGDKKLEVEEVLLIDVADCLDKYKVFKIEELRKATNGFDAGFIVEGSVYRGCIDHEIYAIKKIKWDAREELKILQKVNHGNLVRLEGFCIDPKDSRCYVVYEYVENGSLYSWLHVEKNKRLSWNTRLRIAIDVANGLQYIHEHTRPKVVHKNIKSSNILLDSNMRAKIASFGLAKSGHNAVTMNIVGTCGYIAPEYLAKGFVSTKMDVFSFGVVLLELISAGEVIDEEGKLLWAKVNGILDGKEEGTLREWMDGWLNEDSCTIESVMKVMVVAIACLHKDPMRRPNMDEIVYALSRNDAVVPFDVSEELHCPR